MEEDIMKLEVSTKKKILVALVLSIVLYFATTPKEFLLSFSYYNIPLMFIIIYLIMEFIRVLYNKIG